MRTPAPEGPTVGAARAPADVRACEPAARCEREKAFRVWGLGFGVWGLGFGVWGSGFRV